MYTLISAENNNHKEILNYAYINDAIFINYKEATVLTLKNSGSMASLTNKVCKNTAIY